MKVNRHDFLILRLLNRAGSERDDRSTIGARLPTQLDTITTSCDQGGASNAVRGSLVDVEAMRGQLVGMDRVARAWSASRAKRGYVVGVESAV